MQVLCGPRRVYPYLAINAMEGLLINGRFDDASRFANLIVQRDPKLMPEWLRSRGGFNRLVMSTSCPLPTLRWATTYGFTPSRDNLEMLIGHYSLVGNRLNLCGPLVRYGLLLQALAALWPQILGGELRSITAKGLAFLLLRGQWTRLDPILASLGCRLDTHANDAAPGAIACEREEEPSGVLLNGRTVRDRLSTAKLHEYLGVPRFAEQTAGAPSGDDAMDPIDRDACDHTVLLVRLASRCSDALNPVNAAAWCFWFGKPAL